MQLALLVGVSQYECLEPLHAVDNDVAGMEKLLGATGKYTEILPLRGFLRAEETKRRIMRFLGSYRGKPIDEVFVYYSGHGDHVDATLSFPMSDWRESERRQTSIKNDELDRWIRELQPALTVKVLDCCYAGVPYVKNIGDLKQALDASKATFRDCYFFFSSRHDQESRFGPEASALSVFTEHFLKVVVAQEDGDVRYQQLVDSLADSLDGHDQEPQFVIQGNAKNVFCKMDAALRAALGSQQLESRAEESRESTLRPLTLVQAVEDDAKNCIPPDEAEATLAQIGTLVGELAPDPQLKEFYDLRVRFAGESDLEADVHGEVAIGKWMKSRGRDFFGWATESEPTRPFNLSAVDWWRSREPVVTGFATSSGLEYDRILADALPNFPNLRRWDLAVVFLWSPRELAVFNSTVSPKRIRWDQYDEPEEVRWRRKHFLRDQLSEVPAHVEALLKGFWATVYESLTTGFGQTPEKPQ